MSASTAVSASATTPVRVEDHMRLVHWVLRRRGYSRRRARGAVGYDDLCQAGMVGLMRAAQTYDASRAGFATYAQYWIWQSVQRTLDNTDSVVRVPVHALNARRKRGESPTPGIRSLNAPVRGRDNASDETWLDRLADEQTPAPDDALEAAERKQLAIDLIDAAGLTSQERRVIKLRVWRSMTLEQIGAELGVTRERIRQIETAALHRLQRAVWVVPGGSLAEAAGAERRRRRRSPAAAAAHA